ncbi:response regulator transcription factor [Billgrantia diversa]|uniref:response regulator transcription factor n=1 Tax=Halomonas sp. MCCC 1A13316 TaxID=2733487 RepID=UPI0018A62248|nr:response regulator transcription factor [Halomonas sp. MCCC 1A13316]QOR39154.1 response regulator transcription factor [Halomonas sp. MCCC 1A13316]
MDTTARILIVEDHSFMLAMLQEYIEQEEDFEVCGTFGSGEAALESLTENVPDFVIADLSLPGISGLELISSVKERYPSLPCAILSGHSERHYADQAMTAGAQGYLLKGDPDELPVAIRHMLQGQRYISPALHY